MSRKIYDRIPISKSGRRIRRLRLYVTLQHSTIEKIHFICKDEYGLGLTASQLIDYLFSRYIGGGLTDEQRQDIIKHRKIAREERTL
jgi:hypothetical protein